MGTKKIQIAGQLTSGASERVVVAADEVMDETQRKRQSEINLNLGNSINSETTRAIKEEGILREILFNEIDNRISKNARHDASIVNIEEELEDRYTKEEVNNIISRTPETDVIVIDVPVESQSDIAAWLDANTPSGTDPETGKDIRSNKLYRVPGPDSNTFSEWAWDGVAYIMLADKDYGIDDEPDSESTNVLSSKGAALTYGEIQEDHEFIDCTTDANGKLIEGIKKKGVKYFPEAEITNAKTKNLSYEKSFDGVHSTIAVSDDKWEKTVEDKTEKIIGGLLKDGTWYFPKLITDEEKCTLFPDIVYRGGVSMPRGEWATIDGHTYRLQSGCMDSEHGWFILAGNRMHEAGVPDETYAVLCVTKSITTFSDAKYFYGQYGHCNDITYNHNTHKVYVTCSHENGPVELKSIVLEFDFDSTEGELTFSRNVAIEGITEDWEMVIHNIEYDYDHNQYIIGNYYTGSIYDADFHLERKNVFYYSKDVAAKILNVSSSHLAAQGVFYYGGYVYKPIAFQQDPSNVSNRFEMGVLIRYSLDGKNKGIQIVRGPNNTGYEFEDVIVDSKHRKAYTLWDGKNVGFMEGYLDNTSQLLPRFLDKNEDLNHIHALGEYIIQNSTVARTIQNYPSDIMTPEGSEEPDYHGFSIEVKSMGVGSFVQYFTAFIGDYMQGDVTVVRGMRHCVEDTWGEWIRID